ncbi:MAG: MFS transporter, partial [Alphaproteobacteria bacterium]
MIAVFVPVFAMLAVQAFGSMANLTLAVMAPAAAPAFGLDASWIGVYSGIMYIGAVASTLVSGGFVSRWGPIRVSQVSLLASGFGLALMPIGSAWVLIPSALLVGLGYGPMTPASSHILARKAPPQHMSLIFSIKQTGVPAGYALAGSLLPVIVVTWDWQTAAWTAAGLCVALAFVLQVWR